MHRLPLYLLLAGLLVTLSLFAVADQPERGTTESLDLLSFYHAETRLARTVTEGSAIRAKETTPSPPGAITLPEDELDDWLLLDSIEESFSIGPGEHYALRLELDDREMEFQPPQREEGCELSETCLLAVERAPRWLRNDLVDALLLYEDWGFLRDIIAEIIINAEDPYVDELVFTFAHLSPQLLIGGAMGWDLEVVIENVMDVYAADEDLDYVRIVDYGDSGDDDYYSTAEYNMKTPEGDTVQVEIDREIYYWFVMHPRLSDEVPMYINPGNGRGAAPPDGKFWRNYLLNEPDDGYESLHDLLDTCGVMYSHLHNNGTWENGAVGIVTQWVREVMEFRVEGERPIQPVRIYAIHRGYCGEHQDITAAAGRAALIPTLGTSSFTEDHVWNEFYDGRLWQTWEPVNNYVGDSLAYEGWGKEFPALFSWRGDGNVWTVTPRYHSNTAPVTVTLTDANGNPVDGARVRIISEALWGGMYLASAEWTDKNGQCFFHVGGNRDIYLSIASEIGNYPANQNYGAAVLAIDDSDADEEYEWDYQFNNEVPTLEVSEADPPGEPLNHFRLELGYRAGEDVAYGILFRDSDFLARMGPAVFDLFICDEDNYAAYTEGEEFEAFEVAIETDSGLVDFVLPENGTWYVVFSNTTNVNNRQRVEIDADLYIDSEFAVPEASDHLPERFAVYPAYPNPFNPVTTLRFDLPRPAGTTLDVFDIQGRKVISREMGRLEAGRHTVDVDLGGSASGVYLYTIRSGSEKAAGKLVLLK